MVQGLKQNCHGEGGNFCTYNTIIFTLMAIKLLNKLLQINTVTAVQLFDKQKLTTRQIYSHEKSGCPKRASSQS